MAFIEVQAVSTLKQLLGAPLYQRLETRFRAVRTRVRWAVGIEIILLAWIYGYLPRVIESFFL